MPDNQLFTVYLLGFSIIREHAAHIYTCITSVLDEYSGFICHYFPRKV